MRVVAGHLQPGGGGGDLRVQLADDDGQALQVALPHVGVFGLLFQGQDGVLAGQVAGLDDVAALFSRPFGDAQTPSWPRLAVTKS